MGLWTRLLGAHDLEAASEPPPGPAEDPDAGYVRWVDRPDVRERHRESTAWDLPADPGVLYEQHSAVRQVVGWIVDRCSSVPFHVYQRASDTDRNRVSDHPVARLLREPQANVTWTRWLAAWVLRTELYGWSGALIAVDERGNLCLPPLDPRHTDLGWWGDWQHPWTVDGPKAGHGDLAEVTIRGESAPWGGGLTIPLDQVIVDWQPSSQPSEGVSPLLDTMFEELALLDAESGLRRAVAENGPNIPSVIERPAEAPPWSDAAFNRFQTQFSDYRRGGGKDGQVPVLEDGMRLRPVDRLQPRDVAETVTYRRDVTVEVSMLFGIIPEMIGLRPGDYAGQKAIREMVTRDVVTPRVTYVEAALNDALSRAGWLDEDMYIEAELKERLRGSFEESAQVLSTAVGAPWLTTNEARAKENLPAIEGGDDPRDAAEPRARSSPHGAGMTRPAGAASRRGERAPRRAGLERHRPRGRDGRSGGAAALGSLERAVYSQRSYRNASRRALSTSHGTRNICKRSRRSRSG